MVFLGSIGMDTNNSVELEGIIRGIEVLIRGGHFPAIIEGDSNILIHMAKRMTNGQTFEKFSPSWCLAYRLDQLRTLLQSYPAISFCHVRREANKAADLLANVGVEGETGFLCDRLEDFGEEEWAQHCRHLASRDVNREA